MLRLKIDYPVGLSVTQFEGDRDFTITGNLAKEYRFRTYDGAYDFEQQVQENINCEGIWFDSEYSQFFAYASSEERAKQFAQDITDWFENLKKLVG